MLPALLLLACSGTSAPAPPPAADAPHSSSYAGHASQLDPPNLVAARPDLAATRLDDCRTCHRPWPGAAGELDACDACHLLVHPPPAGAPAAPASFHDTLNPFGLDYGAAGRTAAGIAAIADRDSDGDGFANAAELDARTFPGDPASHPGQTPAPTRTFSKVDLVALPRTEDFLLLDASKDPVDAYTTYAGARLVDLLAAAGVDLATPGPSGVTTFAADGYARTLDWTAVTTPAEATVVVAGLDVATLGAACGWVTYPAVLPANAAPPWALLGLERDGAPLPTAQFDATGRLGGEGPLRLVVPLRHTRAPDRGAKVSPTTCGDGHDFDPSLPHNAGDMVRAVVAIRVEPMPPGLEEPDLASLRSNLTSGAVTVYGFGVTNTPEKTP